MIAARSGPACRGAARSLAGLGLLVLLGSGAAAQDTPGRPVVDPTVAEVPGLDATPDPGDGTSRRTGRRLTPFVAPIPFKNTQIGWGVAGLVGLIHRFDPDTAIKPSTGAIGGFYSENGSWGVMALEMARLAGDAWRIRGMASHMEVAYDYYGIGEDAGQAGRSVGVDQTINLGVALLLRRVVRGVYVGPQVVWMQSTVTLDDTAGQGVFPSAEDLSETGLFAPGFQVEVDTRDDDYWPTSGSFAKLKALFFVDGLGGSRTFQRYQAAWSWYGRLAGRRLVLATNLTLCGTASDVPFYGLCSIGTGRFGLRGYTQGRYRDELMTTVQGEVRFHTGGRFGAVAFGGFGQVAPDLEGVTEAELLPAGGAGLRFQLTRSYPMHLRADYAWGKDGGLLYFSVSEAF